MQDLISLELANLISTAALGKGQQDSLEVVTSQVAIVLRPFVEQQESPSQ